MFELVLSTIIFFSSMQPVQVVMPASLPVLETKQTTCVVIITQSQNVYESVDAEGNVKRKYDMSMTGDCEGVKPPEPGLDTMQRG